MEVKVAHSAQDWRRAKEVLGREHGLGAGSEAGDRLCQLVMEEGKLASHSHQDKLAHSIYNGIRAYARTAKPKPTKSSRSKAVVVALRQ